MPTVFHQQVTWEAKLLIDAFQMVNIDLDIAKENLEV